jgi:hypothetical protein
MKLRGGTVDHLSRCEQTEKLSGQTRRVIKQNRQSVYFASIDTTADLAICPIRLVSRSPIASAVSGLAVRIEVILNSVDNRSAFTAMPTGPEAVESVDSGAERYQSRGLSYRSVDHHIRQVYRWMIW